MTALRSRQLGYKRDLLHLERVSLARIAEAVGTPAYVYSRGEIEASFHAYARAFSSAPHLICFALKANPSLAVGRILARQGAGVDIVSGGELHRALMSGFSPERIVFSGVGKTHEELASALRRGVRMINVESAEELGRLNAVARGLRIPAPFSLRVNPDVRAGGHPHISTGTPENKFGVHHRNIFPLYAWAARQRYLKPVGIQSHIGSQITRVTPFRRAAAVLLDLVRRLRGIGVVLEIVDVGGGLGVDYDGTPAPAPERLAEAILPVFAGEKVTLFLEPGRSLVAQAGVLLTRVLYRKDAGSKHFVIVDAGMNDLARPALYDAYHEIVPVRRGRAGRPVRVDVVGPVCESGDYLARNRTLAVPAQGALLAVQTVGAYGFAMSSQYNARPRGPEVLVQGGRFDVIRRRETLADLVRGERIPRLTG